MCPKTGVDSRLLPMLLVLLAALIGVVAEAYEPLSPERARAYMAHDPQGAMADIIALDLIEHSMPDVVMPERVFTWKGEDLMIQYRPAWISLDIGPLSYRVLLEPERVKAFRPRPSPRKIIIIGTACLGIGTLIGIGLGSLLSP